MEYQQTCKMIQMHAKIISEETVKEVIIHGQGS